MSLFTQWCDSMQCGWEEAHLSCVLCTERLNLWIISQLQTLENIGNKCVRCLKMDIVAVWLSVCVSIKGLVPGITKSV